MRTVKAGRIDRVTVPVMRFLAVEGPGAPGGTAQGRVLSGLHHAIHLSDPRRIAPEKLKTILRQPVRADV